MPDKAVIRVVAGVMRDEKGRYFIAKRRPFGSNAGKWEFPGGKTEPGETDEHALERELREELAIETRTGAFLREIPIETESRFLLLEYYRTELVSGTPRAVECADFAFIDTKDFNRYDFSYADRVIADSLTEE